MLIICADDLIAIRLHASTAHPEECCGLLGGVDGRIMRGYPIPNISPTPQYKFIMEPRAQLKALSDIEKCRWELVAIYHSHPASNGTEPSETDLRENTYPDALMIIIAPDINDRWIARAFQIVDMRPRQVPIEIHP